MIFDPMTFRKNFFQKTSMIPVLLAIGFMIAVPAAVSAAKPNPIPDEGLLPELQAIVPTHLQMHNSQQKETFCQMRFLPVAG